MAAGSGLPAARLAPAGVVIPVPFRARLVSVVRQVSIRSCCSAAYKDDGGFGRARSRRGLLGSAPALAVACVFYEDAPRGKCVSQTVRCRPLFARAGCRSLVEQLLQFRFE